MQHKAIPLPALRISAATTELVKGILALYPQASIVPRLTPLEDEDISVEVRLPVPLEEIYYDEKGTAMRRLRFLDLTRFGERLLPDGRSEVLIRSATLKPEDRIITTKISSAANGLLVNVRGVDGDARLAAGERPGTN